MKSSLSSIVAVLKGRRGVERSDQLELLSKGDGLPAEVPREIVDLGAARCCPMPGAPSRAVLD